jgi:hypothetical protein
MELRDRVLEMIKLEKLNKNKFYLATGLSPGFIEHLGAKLNTASVKRISEAFPHWNIEYIKTGDGDKYLRGVPVATHVFNGKIQNSSVQQANYTNCNELVKLLSETTAGYQEMIKKRDNQVDRLISLLEKSR